MAIITRSGVFGHDFAFGQMRKSILQQDYSQVHHLISTENSSCGYLPPWREEPASPCGVRTTIVPVSLPHYKLGFSDPFAGGNNKRCPYNYLLQELINQVSNRSWIMIVDDDALLLTPHHVRNVMRVASKMKTNTVLLQPSLVGDNASTDAGKHPDGKTVWPMVNWHDRFACAKVNATTCFRVDMTNIVMHKSMASQLHITNVCGADKNMFLQLMKRGAKVRYMNNLDVGIWGNSRGAARGGSTVGNHWRAIGTTRPTAGIELHHRELARWLAPNQTYVSRETLRKWDLRSIRSDNFIMANNHWGTGGTYYQPAESESLKPPAEGCKIHKKLEPIRYIPD